MRLSARVDYALRAVVELASGPAGPDRPVTADQLAQAQGIPPKFLESILLQLRRGGVVNAQRGPEGGYWLARPAADISLADVSAIRIYKSTPSGAETAGFANQWIYAANAGPLIAGQRLDFAEQSNAWSACSRNNVSPADSAGISIRYLYRGRTPLRFFIPGLGSLNMSDSAVMPLNASR